MLAVGDVDNHANYSFCLAVLVKVTLTGLLRPNHAPVSTGDAIGDLEERILWGQSSDCGQESVPVIWMYSRDCLMAGKRCCLVNAQNFVALSRALNDIRGGIP